jgi:hypothetical protein
MLKTMNGAQLFQGPMAAAAKSMSTQDAAALLAPILGKGAGAIVQVLQSDMEEVGEKMRKLGSIMSTETAVSLKMMKDEMELLGSVMVSRFAPAILTATEAIYKIIAGLAGWWTFIKTYFSPNEREKKQAELNSVVPGFGGFTTAQKELREKLKAEIQALPERNAFEDSLNAAADEVKKWQDGLDDIRKQIAEQSSRIRNPLAITGEAVGVGGGNKNFGKLYSDSLVAVGNFLGAGRTTGIQRIAEQSLDVQRQMLSLMQEYFPESREDF